jgi:CheY-like chemotaxis protein
LEARAVRLDHSTCKLVDVVENAAEIVKEVARSRSIELRTEVNPADAVANADAKRLGQIITEMLAIGAISCPVGSELQLDLECWTSSVLEIMLRGGPATSEFVLAREQAAVTESARKAMARVRRLRPIGFALLEELVKLHRGSLSFQASAEGGMGIWVQLSLELGSKLTRPKTAPLVRRNPRTEPLFTPATISTNSPLVLLADDQPALSSITRDYLESIGLRVEVAFDGQEAVNKTFQLRPDLIMMDVQMPVMDGLEAIRRIRQCSEMKLAQVPIISLSGLAVSGDMEKCLSAGATSYLAKPFGVQQLHRAIRDFISMP